MLEVLRSGHLNVSLAAEVLGRFHHAAAVDNQIALRRDVAESSLSPGLIQILRRFPDSRVEDFLLDRLGKMDARFDFQILNVLAEIGTSKSIEPMVLPPKTEPIVSRVLG